MRETILDTLCDVAWLVGFCGLAFTVLLTLVR